MSPNSQLDLLVGRNISCLLLAGYVISTHVGLLMNTCAILLELADMP